MISNQRNYGTQITQIKLINSDEYKLPQKFCTFISMNFITFDP